MVELSDARGLIFGARIGPNGARTDVHLDDADLLWPGTAEVDWLHFNLSDTRATQWIAACPRLPEGARDILLGVERQVRIERAEGGIAGVLAGLYHDFRADPEEVGFLQFYMDKALVVTGRRHPLMAMDRLRHLLRGGSAPTGTAGILRAVTDAIEDDFRSAVGALALAIDDLDDALLADRIRSEHGQLGQQRRLMARLRRYVAANRQAIANATRHAPEWLAGADVAELRQTMDRLDGLAQDLELTQERARLLSEELAARVGKATNDNLYVLSIITALFLPVTLITGIFGMNVGGLPWVHSASGFWWVMGVMVVTATVTLLALHWRRLF